MYYNKSNLILYHIFFALTCELEIQARYHVTFCNSANQMIDVMWKTNAGKEVLMKSQVAPGARIGFNSYFTHQWIFKGSSSSDRFLANANGITEEFFEGGHFKVKPEERINVTILNGI